MSSKHPIGVATTYNPAGSSVSGGGGGASGKGATAETFSGRVAEQQSRRVDLYMLHGGGKFLLGRKLNKLRASILGFLQER